MENLFDIVPTLSFNKDRLTKGNEYDYVTRTSQNQGVLQCTGFVNKSNINKKGTWSLGLLQMDFFYRERDWYAGQFVRKIVPKIDIPKKCSQFFTVVLNGLKNELLSVLVRDVDKRFLNSVIKLPVKNGEIDFDFMGHFISSLENERIELLKAYLQTAGLVDYELTEEEVNALRKYDKLEFRSFDFNEVFENIKQGRRLKKQDQLNGVIPFVMAGVGNNGVVNYISNPVASFPKNSITIDIFGNTFYRNYDFGAGDDTGVYYSLSRNYSQQTMLYFATAMFNAVKGKFDFGKKLRSSQSLNFKMILPVKNNHPNYDIMDLIISAHQKLVIKDIVLYVNKKQSF